jgi:uncharacterized protein (TIGR02271 family)
MATHTKKVTHDTVVGVFNSRTEAEAAVRDLRAAGFTDDAIGLVGRNAEGKVTKTSGDTYADEGAVAGAVAGAGAMALGSLAVSFGVIPVIGPVLAMGPLAAALISAGAGAAAGSLTGALIGWGIPEDDASYYEGEVKAGRFVVTVEAAGRSAEAWTVLHRHGGHNRANPASAAAGRARATAATTETGQTMQLKEEQLHVSKHPVRKGEVEVRKEVVTEQRQITVPVEREEIVIERKPAHGRAASGTLAAEEIRVPVTEEEVDVRKETVVKEEVSVGKRKVTDQKTVAGTVRKEELRVEEEGDVEVQGETTARPTRKK